MADKTHSGISTGNCNRSSLSELFALAEGAGGVLGVNGHVERDGAGAAWLAKLARVDSDSSLFTPDSSEGIED
jgi:hypothetical protein